jgi:hypothetical protein
MSDMSSDKFLTWPNATAQYALARGACEGGSDPRTFWAAESRKSGVAPAPAKSGFSFCVTFLILASFNSSFSGTYALSTVKKVVKTKLQGR